MLAATALSALLALGQAAPPALELSWAATPACSSREEVTAEVARLLRSATGEERNVRARAVLSAIEGGAVAVDLELEIAGISHQRAFVAESCQAAKSAIALIVAIAIDPTAAQTTTDAGDASKGEDEAPPAPPEASSTKPARAATQDAAAPEPRQSERPRTAELAASFSLAAGAVVDVGTLPNPTPGGELTLGFRAAHLRLEAAASLFRAQTALERTSAAGASFSPQSAELRVGYGWELGSVWLGPFGVAGLTRLHAAGQHGSVANFDSSQLMPALGAGGLLVWAVAPRKGPRLPLGEEPADPDQQASPGRDPYERAVLSENTQLLRRLLDTLDDEKREVLVLTELEELSAPEIAEALGINLNTAYSRLRLAREQFEAALRRERARERGRQP